MKFQVIVILATLSILCGCTATPDLSTFANASKELKAGVNDVEQQVLGKVNYIAESLETGRKVGFVQTSEGVLQRWELFSNKAPDAFKASQKDFITHLATVNATMSAMVQYTEALATLAAAGETGSESSQSMIESVNSIFSTLSIAYPGGSIVSDGVANATNEVAQLFTRIQAQDSLAETMSSAQPAVDALANLISEQSETLSKLTSGLARLERQIIDANYGRAKMDYYHDFSSYEAMDNLYADMQTCASNHKDDLEALWSCHITKEKAIGSRLDTLARISDEYNSYISEKMNTKKWTNLQRQKITAIQISVKAWANTHKNAATLLNKCGGMRSLRNSCGSLSVSNLKASIDWLKSIKEGFEQP